MNHRKAVIVPVSQAEALRSELLGKGMLDHSRKIKVSSTLGEEFLEIPVTGEIACMETIEQPDPEYYIRQHSLRDLLKGTIPENDLALVPSGWHVLGKIIIVSIDERIEGHRQSIASKLLGIYPQCHTVIRDRGIEGQFRQPQREILLGTSTETTHKENGCLFRLDVTKVMFSKGNLYEKKLMSTVGSGEFIVDMFAGIGYFTIPIAVHAKPAKIYAIEINPESFTYLQENIRLNKVGHIVEAMNGDCAVLTPQGIADRVLMGYVGTTHEYLEYGIRAIKSTGGMLHYHETTPEPLIYDRPIARITEAALREGRQVDIRECRKVKKYSPGVWHVVVDAWIY
ncbi:class I SAM-dependent methyltransferase [Methanolobus chelungpuianus]|uniref:tRNA(Phe) (4-demethylwyosine(37)-C(7)) aminocarboxypropyltransferase n=1 Tax=Methanolobus chelungpuianus TaxID=502115 RepID=A0AAE3KZL1_9EURY|nr:class I SAM-dependent methyltransferase family protein [Methanolobus chelungpuianus]MCQ6963469.1 methyltransferase [Methanolobus chelungpuianus]